MILNMIWQVLFRTAAAIKLYTPINFKYQNTNIYKDALKIIVEHFFF